MRSLCSFQTTKAHGVPARGHKETERVLRSRPFPERVPHRATGKGARGRRQDHPSVVLQQETEVEAATNAEPTAVVVSRQLYL